MTAIIVEDEELARQRICQLLSKHASYINVLAQIDNGNEAIERINSLKPGVVFLDIKLLDMTAFDVIKCLSDPLPFIIFTTAYADFALDAFETFAIDYLVKPINQERFDKAITKLKTMNGLEILSKEYINQINNSYEKSKPKHTTISTQVGNKIVLTEFKDITHISAENKYTTIHTKFGKELLCNKTLLALEEVLPDQFIRIHRSYIINKDYILHINKYFKGRYLVALNDSKNTVLMTSDGYKESIKVAFAL